MKIFLRILSILLVVAIPIVTICLGINVATRMPDVYQYEFKSTDILDSMNIDLTDDEMGEFISHFMMGRTSQFQLWTEDDDKPDPVFSNDEMAAASQLRHDLNVLTIVSMILIIPMLIAFILLRRKELNQEIRKYYCRGLLLYVILLIVAVISITLLSSAEFTIWHLTDYVVKEETTDLLPQLITEGLVRKIELASLCISGVFMGIIGYVIYKITAPKRIFSRN
ncbi:DUF1461 domain-containing protein [Clostridium aminobutyricum]|uniref:DUF1461 domain-containing protein n=1 Tax=Clostridium aminobutyricum TaxID=33953 RepID=A0A939D933_CLOAM|nr:DUF1461 domain-containing protein [Clostridium aminobutyricum]MBN7773709.1 DUF1461 domain-containing protein [Clostridium aminobutyricum]